MSQTFTGVRAIFKIRGEQVAYASNVSYTINHALQAIEVLDRINPVEHAEVGYSVDCSCSVFRVANRSAIGLGIQPRLEAILTQPELVIELIDKVEGVTVLRISGVKIQTRSGSVDARGVATETWNFVGIKAGDEASE